MRQSLNQISIIDRYVYTEFDGRPIYKVKDKASKISKCFYIFEGGAVLCLISGPHDLSGRSFFKSEVQIVATSESYIQIGEDLLRKCS